VQRIDLALLHVKEIDPNSFGIDSRAVFRFAGSSKPVGGILMKKLIHLLLLSVLLSVLFGCTTADRDYETRLRPPDDFNPVYLRYKELAGEKIMVIAIDMGGHWAFGYDHNRNSLSEAAENAAIKCDKARKKHKVFNKAKLFAVNDEIVYFDNQFK